MPEEDNIILKYNPGEKFMKVPFIFYVELECILEKMSTCHNNPEKPSTTKTNKHTPSGYSLFTHCLFDNTKNILSYYRGEDCVENLCLDLREQITKIIKYKKRNDAINKQRGKSLSYMQKGFSIDGNNKEYYKVRDHNHYTGEYRGATHSICNLRYKTPKKFQ